MRMNKKQPLDYDSPSTQLIELRVESGILYVSGGEPGAAGNNLNKGNSWGFGDDDE